MKFVKKVWEQVDDFVLELLRVALLGAYSSVFAFLTDSLNGTQGDWQVTATIGLLVLKAVDRFLHEKGIAKKGITRF